MTPEEQQRYIELLRSGLTASQALNIIHEERKYSHDNSRT